MYPVAPKLVSTLSSTAELLLSMPVLTDDKEEELGLEGGMQGEAGTRAEPPTGVHHLSHPLIPSLQVLSLLHVLLGQ